MNKFKINLKKAKYWWNNLTCSYRINLCKKYNLDFINFTNNDLLSVIKQEYELINID